MRRYGGLRSVMPITFVTFGLGYLAIIGVPPFSGFFSKDAIIEATHLSQVGGHRYAYFAVLAATFVTAFYSFRLLFMTFHGTPRFDVSGHGHETAGGEAAAVGDPAQHDTSHEAGAEPDGHAGHGGPPRESPWVITVPLILLAIPSVYSGWQYIQPMLFGGYFGHSIVVSAPHDVVGELAGEWHGVWPFILHGLAGGPFWLGIAGIAAAAWCYLINPAIPARIQRRLPALYAQLDNKYYVDRFNDWFFAGGSREVGGVASNLGDRRIIDGFFVNGAARVVGASAALVRHLQSGYVYHYAFTMIVGVFVLLYWWGVR
jgi:NADH-quinone oxidoreductase subunit L